MVSRQEFNVGNAMKITNSPEQTMRVLTETMAFLNQPYSPKRGIFERRSTFERRLAEHKSTIQKARCDLRNRMERCAKKYKIKLCSECGGSGTILSPTNIGIPGQRDYTCSKCSGVGWLKTTNNGGGGT